MPASLLEPALAGAPGLAAAVLLLLGNRRQEDTPDVPLASRATMSVSGGFLVICGGLIALVYILR
jgi:hypothetical protein